MTIVNYPFKRNLKRARIEPDIPYFRSAAERALPAQRAG